MFVTGLPLDDHNIIRRFTGVLQSFGVSRGIVGIRGVGADVAVHISTYVVPVVMMCLTG